MESNWPDVLFTAHFQHKVLLVGAGGIGSEVIKTLVLTGFRKISLIDLDTIDTSNLNRQFLFRSTHVGESKAKVAAEAVKAFLPTGPKQSPLVVPLQKRQKLDDDVTAPSQWPDHGDALEVIPYHANIKDSQFNVSFFRGFDVVLNGLDNLDARRHVNRLCLAAEVPLIESGTAGYEGSVTVHMKGRSHCYECEEKQTPKSFPICTIRNTPDKMIHCVVWAKELLFARLFGAQNQTTDLDEEVDVEDNGHTNKSFFLSLSEESSLDYAMRIFKRVFDQDIQTVLKMENLWTNRNPPTPIHWSFEYIYPEPLDLKNLDIYKNLTLSESVTLFLVSVCTMLDMRKDQIGTLTFDKDDEVSMAFVASSSNLRAHCYSIPTLSYFDLKGMAGNIVHAIATTNAVVAGMIVNECCKVLSGCHRFLKESFIGKHTSWRLHKRKRDYLIQSMLPPSENPHCIVCGTSSVLLSINTKTTTLNIFLAKVIKGALSVLVPNLSCGGFMYEEGEGLDDDEKEEYEALLEKCLEKLPGGGIQDNSIVEVQSQIQHFHCKIIISHKEDIDEEKHPEGFILSGSVPDSTEELASDVKLMKRKRSMDLASLTADVILLSEDESESEEAEEVKGSKSKKKKL